MLKMWAAIGGYKTYFVAGATVLYAVAGLWGGTMSQDAAVAMIFGGAGLGALRHGVSSTMMQLAQKMLPLVLDALKQPGRTVSAVLLSAALAGTALLAGCGNTSQVASELSAALSSPAGQALVTMITSYSPGISTVTTKINRDLALAQSDKQVVCGAVSQANGGFQLFAPLLGASAADMAAEAAAFRAVSDACDNDTSNIASLAQAGLKLYGDITAMLTSGGVLPASPVTSSSK